MMSDDFEFLDSTECCSSPKLVQNPSAEEAWEGSIERHPIDYLNSLSSNPPNNYCTDLTELSDFISKDQVTTQLDNRQYSIPFLLKHGRKERFGSSSKLSTQATSLSWMSSPSSPGNKFLNSSYESVVATGTGFSLPSLKDCNWNEGAEEGNDDNEEWGQKPEQQSCTYLSDPSGSPFDVRVSSEKLPDISCYMLPRYAAAFSTSNLGWPANTSRRLIEPFGSLRYFSFLRSLPQAEFVHLARSVARYRRSSRVDSTPSTIVSVNLCGCLTPHTAAISNVNLEQCWKHRQPTDCPPCGVLDAFLSVMLVELHADLDVLEFLDRRLPAIIRQQVGNRLDRNFVVQISGISFMRGHLASNWTIGDLPECTDNDMKRLNNHPLYHHMITDISHRHEQPVFRNLNLCPIQVKQCPTRTVTA